MKLTLEREKILKPIQQVGGVVEKRQTMPILSNILVKVESGNATLTGTDMEVEMIAKVEVSSDDTGEFTIPARKFTDICRNLPEDTQITLNLDGERVTVQAGRSRFTLSTLPVNDFPVLDRIVAAREFQIEQRVLKRLLEKTQLAMAQQDVRYYLNGLMLEMGQGHLRAVATDGHRLALSEEPMAGLDAEPHQIIIPKKGVTELQRLLDDSEGTCKVEVGSNHIRVETAETCFTTKLIDGKFPDYNRVIPPKGENQMTVNRSELRQALVRTSILSNEKYRGIRINLDQGLLKILAHNPEHEEAEEEVTVDYQGIPLDIGFNANYIQDALGAIETDQVHLFFIDPNSSCLIEPDTPEVRSKYVVMPMRL